MNVAVADGLDPSTVPGSVTAPMLESQMLLEPIVGCGGSITDFIIREANSAACTPYLGPRRAELVGRRLAQAFPNIGSSDLLAQYVRCAGTGEPVIIDDVEYFVDLLGATRRYEIRGTRTPSGWIAVNYRDVTERYETTRRLADSEEHYRLLADNSSDVLARFRDGKIVWISSSVVDALGAPPLHWIGRQVTNLIPTEDLPIFTEILALTDAGDTVVRRLRVFDAAGVAHWVEVHAKTFYDAQGDPDGRIANLRVVDAEVAAEQMLEEARRHQARLDARYRRLMDSSVIATGLVSLEGRFQLVKEAMCALFGYGVDALRQMTCQELTVPGDLHKGPEAVADMLAHRRDSVRFTKRYRHKNGHHIVTEVLLSCLRSPQGHAESFITQLIDVTERAEAPEQFDESTRQRAVLDARCHTLMKNSIVPTALNSPEGRFVMVNEAMCKWFGYDADTLLQMNWQELTTADYLQADPTNVEDMLAGRVAAYRVTKPFIRADGEQVWGDVLASCLLRSDGTVEHLVTQIVDITDEVESRQQLARREEQNRVLAEDLRRRTDRLQFELDSAAHYVDSILPTKVEGPVGVSSLYLPCRTLGGDCYDYRWIDDDHLIVKLLDVSGHGVESALLAVSIHNLLRAGTVSPETLRSPHHVLTELNRLFPMDDHGGHYFTVWYGVYQPSTRTLSYASAGHPPALAFTAEGTDPIELFTPSGPIGMFDDSEFHTATYHVAPGTQLLIYSDGAYELALPNGIHWSLTEFVALCAELTGSPSWSLDTIVDRLHKLQSSGLRDDCSLIKLDFP